MAVLGSVLTFAYSARLVMGALAVVIALVAWLPLALKKLPLSLPIVCVGIGAVRITQPKKLKKQLAAALATPGPVLIDVVTDPDALSMPPKITAQQIRGFATASTKVVLGGGVSGFNAARVELGMGDDVTVIEESALRRAIMGSVVSNIMEWYTIGVCPSTPISPS